MQRIFVSTNVWRTQILLPTTPLQAVGFPVAVNPETRLASIARKRGWLVEHWSKAKEVPGIFFRLARCYLNVNNGGSSCESAASSAQCSAIRCCSPALCHEPKASARIAPVHLRNVDDPLNQPVWAGRKSPLGSLEFAVQILRSSMAMRLPTLKTSSHFR